jgi:hypothetical protein
VKKNVRDKISSYVETEVLCDVIQSKGWGKVSNKKKLYFTYNFKVFNLHIVPELLLYTASYNTSVLMYG